VNRCICLLFFVIAAHLFYNANIQTFAVLIVSEIKTTF